MLDGIDRTFSPLILVCGDLFPGALPQADMTPRRWRSIADIPRWGKKRRRPNGPTAMKQAGAGRQRSQLSL
jgi:hypothetical protein